jgi:hypothetical protein
MSAIKQIISPNRVREMMAAMTKKIEATLPSPKVRGSKEYNACQMVIKTSCSVSSAARSWNVPIRKILDFAKKNNIHIVHKPYELDDKAKAIVESGKYMGEIPRGMKHRVAYELALKVGASQACRTLKLCRRGLYYYCDRYNLPTPERSERRVR